MTTDSGRSIRRTTIVALAAALAIGGAVTAIPHSTPAFAAAGVEDEGAACAVPTLPDAGSLPTNAKLPDPFKKLDGTRITTTAGNGPVPLGRLTEAENEALRPWLATFTVMFVPETVPLTLCGLPGFSP